MVNQNDPLLPEHLVAEQAVLGFLLSTSSPLDIDLKLSADCFADPVHAAIFQAITECDTTGKPRSVFTVRAALEASGALDEVGGVSYLAQLLHLYADEDGSHTRLYQDAALIVEAWRCRRLVDVCERLAKEATKATFGFFDGYTRQQAARTATALAHRIRGLLAELEAL